MVTPEPPSRDAINPTGRIEDGPASTTTVVARNRTSCLHRVRALAADRIARERHPLRKAWVSNVPFRGQALAEKRVPRVPAPLSWGEGSVVSRSARLSRRRGWVPARGGQASDVAACGLGQEKVVAGWGVFFDPDHSTRSF